MGIEAAPFLFGIPFVVCLALLLVFALDERKRFEHEERVLGLGRGRLAQGYFGALGALLFICIFTSLHDRDPEIGVLLSFMVFGLLLVVLLTVLVLPIIALLRRLRFASLLGVTCAATALSIVLGVIMDAQILVSALVGGILALTFCIAAGLPFLRSAPMPANNSLERTREG